MDMKKIITAFIALSVILTGQQAYAAQTKSADTSNTKTMVIIDTGIDMTHNLVKNNIVYEVCFAGYKSCPNGQNQMEGAGSATLPTDILTNKSWIHGTSVVSAATQTDPSIKIIEIRCASLIAPNGYIGCNNDLFTNALNWAYQNKDKFNIGAVVSPLGTSPGICNTVKAHADLITKIKQSGIPVILPSGNNFNYKNISSPACYPDAIAVSSIDDKGRLALYANYSSEVDFATTGNMKVAKANNTMADDYGTSLSVAVFGAQWLIIKNQKSLSYDDEINLIKSTSNNVTNIMVKLNVPAINLQNALK
jgi:hypothetical protein